MNVYSYPRGALLGSLGNVGGNLCSDKAGDVFDSFNAEVLEYAHGAELPKETLYTPSFAGPCSVDPTSGNLGVVSGFPNAVVVFPYNQKRGWRFAKEYIVANMEFVHYCGYDGSGNLFIDGTTSSGYAFAELPKDGKVVEPLVLNQNFVNPGAIQWDGSYITFADRGQSYPSAAVIYRFTVSGYFGTEVGSTTLSQSNADGQFWIQDGRVVGQYLPAKYDDGVGIWAYPAGGAPLKTFATGTIADSETVSVAGR
ncbi:MAG: hypothetical protein JO324_07160 [Candidatus Eremiobacteraeota bacterium]|nr:hypothetical protein [Candidatus Eremiobacteraeota bacterium]